MSKSISVSKARKDLSSVVAEIQQSGEEITLTRWGKPVAKILPFREMDPRYPLRGWGSWISPDFDEPIEDPID